MIRTEMFAMSVPAGKGKDGTDYGFIYETGFGTTAKVRERAASIYENRGYTREEAEIRAKTCILWEV